jgi:tripartite-type tricarboxylate transporter receptor subunit TctC
MNRLAMPGPDDTIDRHFIRDAVMHIVRLTALFVLAFAPFSTVVAQGFPSKPVRLVVPLAPGGGTDLLARVIAGKFQDRTGQTMVVDNKPGAGGNIAAELTAKAPPDGYTVHINTNSLTTVPYLQRSMPYDLERDLAPVTMLCSTAFFLIAPQSLAVKTIPELIAHAKANPNKLSYGGSGVGSLQHLGTEYLQQLTGIQMTHIPYKGAAPAVADLLTGQIQLLYAATNVALPLVRSGKVKALGVAELRRYNAMPDVPAIAETLPGYELAGWYAIWAPAKTPAALVQQLSTEFQRIMEAPDVKEKLAPLGFDAKAEGPEHLRKVINADLKRWAGVVKTAGIQPE